MRAGDTATIAASTNTAAHCGDAAGGMSLRSGQVKSTHTNSDFKLDCGSGSDAEQASAPSKRRRRSKPALDDYEYSQLSDPEERKLEKRRAKNRRTARVSRERKQAEVARMKEQLNQQATELQRLQEMIHERDTQIAQMKNGVSSSGMGAPQERGQSTRQRASESAALKTCLLVAKRMLTKRTALSKTVPPSCLTICTAPSCGDDVDALRRQLRELLVSVPESERRGLLAKIEAAARELHRQQLSAAQRRDSLIDGEVSDESDV